MHKNNGDRKLKIYLCGTYFFLESNRDFGDDDLVVISADENQSEESNEDVDIIEAPIDSLDSESPPVITLPENILDGLQIGMYTYYLLVEKFTQNF